MPTAAELSEDQQLLHDTTVRFIEAELPLSATRALHDDPQGYDSEWLKQAGGLGWFSLLIPEECGGGSVSGHGLLDLAVVADSIGRFVQPGPFIPMNVAGWAIAAGGDGAQRAAILPGLVAGRAVTTWAPFSASGRWDEGAGLAIDRRGDDIVLRGVRGLVEYGQTAEQVLVVGVRDDEPTLVLVPVSTAGVGIDSLTGLDISRRYAELTFDDVHLPMTALVGGAALLERQLQLAVVLACAETVGALDAMAAMTVAYSKERIAFGRPIGSFQALKHVMADMAVYLEGCKAVAAEAARIVDLGGDEAAEVVSMAASYIDERATEIAQQCLQIHGGIGFTWEHDLHLLMRRTRATTSLWCDQVWHRERICQVHGL